MGKGAGRSAPCTVVGECLRVKSKNIIGAGLIKEERPVAKTVSGREVTSDRRMES